MSPAKTAALQGGYCHVCGQRAHNPLHSFSHAIEEVFESLWHLDGRIFRTMRDLLVPGRVAVNYLAGHRVRYIAPLRIFIVLTLLTFFVAHFTIDFNNVNFEQGRTAISDAKTVPEVIRLRDAALKDLRDARTEMEKTGAVHAGGDRLGDCGSRPRSRAAHSRTQCCSLKPNKRYSHASKARGSGPADCSRCSSQVGRFRDRCQRKRRRFVPAVRQ